MQSVALMTQPYKTTFFPAQFTISARATAWVPPTPCVYLLSQYSSQPSLYAINQTITGNCPFSIGLSYYFNGGSSSSGNQFFLHGDSANSSGNVSPTPIHAPYMSDPLARVVQPSFGGCTYSNMSVTATATLQPGTYCGGLSVNTTARVTLNPGVYVISGNLTINGHTLIGAGVTFFMTSGGGSVCGVCSITNVNATLSAPASGTWQGILF